MSYIIHDVTQITLPELYERAKARYNKIWNSARNAGRDVKLYLHWTAARYHQFWSPYHIQIDADGTIYLNDNIDLAEISEGTWRRNSGSISLTALCMFDGSTRSGGTNPITKEQVEALSRATVVLADALDLSIDLRHVLTHGEAADNEDLEVLWTDKSQVFNPWATDGSRGGDVIRGKANWYRQTYPDGTHNHFLSGAGK